MDFGIKLTPRNILLIAVGVAIGIIAVVVLVKLYNKKTFSTTRGRRLRATTSGNQCILSTAQSTLTNIQSQVTALVAKVNALTPAPTSDVLQAFNTAVTALNAQITSLLAMPVCCSGLNQQYDSGSGLCTCVSPFGLDTSGNCSISCTFPQSSYTGGTCGCNTGYNLLPTNDTCDNPSNDTINSTYLPQLTQFTSQLSALLVTVPNTSTLGSVTQTGSITTAVTLNSIGGTIQTVTYSYPTGGVGSFTLNNTSISSNSIIIVCNAGGNWAMYPSVSGIKSGSCQINIANLWDTGPVSATIAVAFYVITPSSTTTTVTQTGTNSSAVTMNSVGGIIQTMGSSLTAGTSTGFTLNNSYITSKSIILTSNVGGTSPNPLFITSVSSIVSSGSCNIWISNPYGGSGSTITETGAIAVAFYVITPATTATVTQTGTIQTAVTLNAPAGTITTVNYAYAGLGGISFTLNNTYITKNSVILVSLGDLFGLSQNVTVSGITNGACTIGIVNLWSASATNTDVVNFYVL
jgi:hypothetical protein